MKTQKDKLFSSTLTAKKKEFLNHPSKSKQMTASEVDAVAQFYQEKYGITILKNGGSEFGQMLIKNGQQRIADGLKPYQDDNTKYCTYLKKYGLSDESKLCYVSIGSEDWGFLMSFIHFYADSYGNINNNISEEDLQRLNELVKGDARAKALVDEAINQLIKEEILKISDYCLSPSEAKQEIAFIQGKLNANELIGYKFTNGHATRYGHFEVFLIGPDKIIKPVSWYGRDALFHTEHNSMPWLELMLDSSLALIVKNLPNKIPRAQADDRACGTLGILYLKELLKDNQQQLREYTMSFPLGDGGRWFFYPSPHVLRYSQSSTYNTLICNMLNDTDEMQSVADGKYMVATLKGLLQQSIERARKNHDVNTVLHNEKLLRELPEFRKKWMAIYEVMLTKRKLMYDARDKNRYLAYSSLRLTNSCNSSVIAWSNWDSWLKTDRPISSAPVERNMCLSMIEIKKIIEVTSRNLVTYLDFKVNNREMDKGYYRGYCLKETLEVNRENPLFLLFVIDAYLDKQTEQSLKGSMLKGIELATKGFDRKISTAACEYASQNGLDMHASKSAILELLDSESLYYGLTESHFISYYKQNMPKENQEKCFMQ